MTRDEAVKIVTLSNPTPYPKAFVQALESLGVLKLDPPPSAEDRAFKIMETYTINDNGSRSLLADLDRAGLKIVEK